MVHVCVWAVHLSVNECPFIPDGDEDAQHLRLAKMHTHKETCARADAQPRSPSSIWLLSASVGHSALVTGTLLILQDPLH